MVLVRPRRLVPFALVVMLAVPFGAAQGDGVGWTTAALMGHCATPQPVVSWENQDDSSTTLDDHPGCASSGIAQSSPTALECAVFEGNKICLVVNSQGLACEWEVTRNTYAAADFVPAYYAAGCKVSAASGGGVSVERHSDDAGNTGAVQVTDAVPGVDVRWSAYVLAFDVEIAEESGHVHEKAVATDWRVSGSYSSGLSLGIKTVFKLVVGSASLGLNTNLKATYGQSSYEYQYDSQHREIKYRQASMVSVSDKLVAVVPTIESIAWSGATWGCDALDVVEAAFGPRQIGGYTTHVKVNGPSSGKHLVNLDRSKLATVYDNGAFFAMTEDPNGFAATYDQTMDFETVVSFGVDYDAEWLPLDVVLMQSNLQHGSSGADDPAIEIQLETHESTAVVAVTNAHDFPPGHFASTANVVTTQAVAEYGSLGPAIAAALLQRPGPFDDYQLLSQSCGPGSADTVEQPWKASLELDFVGTGAVAAKVLDVDVVLDLAANS